MKLMVLNKDERWGLHKAKVYEECLELVEAINSDDDNSYSRRSSGCNSGCYWDIGQVTS